MQVMIVGAGPTGLTAAVELMRRGIGVRVVERRPGGAGLSRAVGITPASLRYLEPSGVAGDLLAEGVKIEGVVVHAGPRPLAHLRFARLARPDAFMLTLPQDRTEAILRTRLEALGGSVQFGREVTGVQQDGHGVRVTFADGTVETCDIVLGADGTRSRVRASLGLPFEGYDLAETWAVADIEATGWHLPGTAAVFLNAKGRIVLVMPIAPGRYPGVHRWTGGAGAGAVAAERHASARDGGVPHRGAAGAAVLGGQGASGG